MNIASAFVAKNSVVLTSRARNPGLSSVQADLHSEMISETATRWYLSTTMDGFDFPPNRPNALVAQWIEHHIDFSMSVMDGEPIATLAQTWWHTE